MILIIIFIGILGSLLTLIFSFSTQAYFVTTIVHLSSIVVYLILLFMVKIEKKLELISWIIIIYYFYLLIGAFISMSLFSHITRNIVIYLGIMIIVLFEKKRKNALLFTEFLAIILMIIFDIINPNTYIKVERYWTVAFNIEVYFNTVIGSMILGFMIIFLVDLYKKILLDAQNELHVRSINDPLTGAFNIRYFEKQMKKNYIWWKMDAIPFSIAILDVDNFKSINDNYGHRKGDELLKSIVAIINDEIYTEDEIYRYGGDEFIVMFPKLDVDKASKLMENVVSNLNGKFDFDENISISVGVCSIREIGKSDLDILKLADKRLYFAKNYLKGSVRSVGGEDNE